MSVCIKLCYYVAVGVSKGFLKVVAIAVPTAAYIPLRFIAAIYCSYS